MRCHLVYSLATTNISMMHKILRKIKLSMQCLHLPISAIGNRQNVSISLFPRSHPASLIKHLYLCFSSKMQTFVYHLHEKIKIKFQPDDIFIGTPFFPYKPGGNGVTELSISQTRRPKLFALIAPLHCNTIIETSHINKPYLDSINDIIPNANILFAIMGQYWWDQWEESPYAHWLPKMVRLDLAVDTQDFPRVKTKFNPAGKRRFLFIGRNDPMKGIDLLTKLISKDGKFSGGWIGGGPDIQGIPRVSPPRDLSPEFMQQIGERFDFFITTGVADPNPTTILESMSWGFPVICTPQSGYYETTYRRNVYHDNIPRSLEVLEELQYAKEEDLMAMANEARTVVETQYTWDKFNSTIISSLGL
jgi:glycosyltransferase involved in cell wall biosynthesis